MSNTIPQQGSHSISLAAAADLTHRLQNNRSSIFQTGFEQALSNAETFNKEDVLNLLAVNGASALRIYYGLDTANVIHAVLVAADANGEDILPANNMAATADPALILEEGVRCPPSCPADSPLMSEG